MLFEIFVVDSVLTIHVDNLVFHEAFARKSVWNASEPVGVLVLLMHLGLWMSAQRSQQPCSLVLSWGHGF